jgi:hypothetical protein
VKEQVSARPDVPKEACITVDIRWVKQEIDGIYVKTVFYASYLQNRLVIATIVVLLDRSSSSWMNN